MEYSVIIVAGGSGSRMQNDLPKQFIPIADNPILMHAISAFKNVFENIRIIVVIPEKFFKLWKDLCTEFSFNVSHSIAKGGQTRFHSVKNGLKYAPNDGIIAIHDGARPFATPSTIKNVFAAAEQSGAAIPVVELNDSVRKIYENGSFPMNREELKLVQTPQCFDAKLIKEAYKTRFNAKFTDDANVVENFGHPITIVAGNFENIKITRTIDLAFAEVMFKKSIFF